MINITFLSERVAEEFKALEARLKELIPGLEHEVVTQVVQDTHDAIQQTLGVKPGGSTAVTGTGTNHAVASDAAGSNASDADTTHAAPASADIPDTGAGAANDHLN